MHEFVYAGPLKEHMVNWIELKQAVGYKYLAESAHIKRFDQFMIEKYPLANILTKEIVLDWCQKRSYESQANQCTRASILRQFGIYLDSVGVPAFVIPKGYYPVESQYVPYIFTPDELRNIFAETEKCHYSPECPHRHLIMPVFFRMIYMCGLRVSEARLLTVSDVDLNNGVLSIHHSKKDNSRLVPMSSTLTHYCQIYTNCVHKIALPGDYYFPGSAGQPLTIQNVYKNFRKFLWQAGISHGGRGSGPRIYDFRHSFAVHCLKRWSEQGFDLLVYLPVLKTYMGHDSFEDTAYYLRLTADVYPEITLKLEKRFPGLIPGLEGGPDETD